MKHHGSASTGSRPTARRAHIRPLPGWAWIVVAIGAFAAGQAWWAWWVSPERLIGNFLAAGRAGDYDAMLSLAGSAEARRLGLDAVRLAYALRTAAGSTGAVRLGASVPEPYNDTQSRYNRAFKVQLTGPDGRGIVDRKGDSEWTYVIAYNSDGGWRICMSELIRNTLAAHQDAGRPSKAQLWAASGLAPVSYDPVYGEWEQVAQR